VGNRFLKRAMVEAFEEWSSYTRQVIHTSSDYFAAM
jgi:hypothetical protein